MFIVISALAAGIGLYYFQVYAFYEDVADGDVQLTSVVSGAPEPILFEGYEGIDADSSPLRYRDCFTTVQSQAVLTETYVIYEGAEPRVAPGWFGCFDADAIGAALQGSEAIAFLGVENVTYGIDRVVAVYPDGRGYSWHQINACGEVVFDGNPVPEECPPIPPNGLGSAPEGGVDG